MTVETFYIFKCFPIDKNFIFQKGEDFVYPVLNWTENPGISAGLIFGALLVLICKDIRYKHGDLQRLKLQRRLYIINLAFFFTFMNPCRCNYVSSLPKNYFQFRTILKALNDPFDNYTKRVG